ncbi:MAG: hypothetical protein J6R04_00990 [Clostridia bacterium]|nr:hypothetical protein [Clostridia bacterium]
MENRNKYLLLARRAREEDNSEDAKRYYDMVRTEDPDNAEAKFFYSYYRLMDGTVGEAGSKYDAMCKGVNTTISLILESDASDEEKKALVLAILAHLEKARIAIVNNAPGSASVNIQEIKKSIFAKYIEAFGEDNDIMFEVYRFKKDFESRSMKEKYEFGDEIESKFASVPQIMALALDLWKKCVAEQQTYYNTREAIECKGMAEKYAEKIKKYDPTYVMPKKAGCISFG